MIDLDRILSFIDANNVLTLCTAGGDVPWAASCFYVFDAEAMVFLCLSDGGTRHGAEMADNPRVAGAIAAQGVTVSKIKGLQFSAYASLAEGQEEERGLALYYRRFPFARLHRAPLWRLAADLLKLTDNSFGFGAKFYWRRESPAEQP